MCRHIRMDTLSCGTGLGGNFWSINKNGVISKTHKKCTNKPKACFFIKAQCLTSWAFQKPTSGCVYIPIHPSVYGIRFSYSEFGGVKLNPGGYGHKVGLYTYLEKNLFLFTSVWSSRDYRFRISESNPKGCKFESWKELLKLTSKTPNSTNKRIKL